MDIANTSAKIANLQVPTKRILNVDSTSISLLGQKSDNYIMSVNYVSLLKCLSGSN